jgi:hypothetical protein
MPAPVHAALTAGKPSDEPTRGEIYCGQAKPPPSRGSGAIVVIRLDRANFAPPLKELDVG